MNIGGNNTLACIRYVLCFIELVEDNELFPECALQNTLCSALCSLALVRENDAITVEVK